MTLDQIIDIARQLRKKSLSRTLAGTVKEVLGTAYSVGCTVNGACCRAGRGGGVTDAGGGALCVCTRAGKTPREVQTGITSGDVVVPDA